MGALLELVGVIVAGFAAFLGMLLGLLGLLVLWLCGLASVLCLMVALFAGVMYWLTGTPHDAQIAVAYLVYAAAPFVVGVRSQLLLDQAHRSASAAAGTAGRQRVAAGAGCGLHTRHGTTAGDRHARPLPWRSDRLHVEPQASKAPALLRSNAYPAIQT